MCSNFYKQGGVLMKKRLLIAGRSEDIIADINTRYSSDYEIRRAAISQENLLELLRSFKPHAAIVSLKNEDARSVAGFVPLGKGTEFADTPVIVIGSDSDCVIFSETVGTNATIPFSEPVDFDALSDFLAQVTDYVIDIPGEAKEAPRSTTSFDEEEIPEYFGEAIVFADEQKPKARKHILVIDDDVRMLKALKMYLEEFYDVTVAPGGKQGEKYLETHTCDLVLLDFVMPDEDGPTVLKKIRQNPRTAKLPVMFLTGVSDTAHVTRCLQLKPDGYLLKPISRENLLKRLAEKFFDM